VNQKLGVQLVSSDQKIISAFPKFAISPEEIVADTF
jgi:hypothetical protein